MDSTQNIDPVLRQVFDWNTAIEWVNMTSEGRATVLGLSIISEQLEYLIGLLARNDG